MTTTKYVFDLDFTLYSKGEFTQTENAEIFYNSFKFKPFLKHLFESIKHKKYIFTNGSLLHAENVLERMHLTDVISNIVSFDMIDVYKPDPRIYDYAIKKFEIHKKDTIIFFEDNLENLEVAKRVYNWITVLITPGELHPKPTYVDYYFKNIEEALLFLLVRNKFLL